MDDRDCHDQFLFILYLLSRSTVLVILTYFNKQNLLCDHDLGKEIQMLEKITSLFLIYHTLVNVTMIKLLVILFIEMDFLL